MHGIEPSVVLDRDQLRDITLNDEELMRDILQALLEDTSAQIGQLQTAISREDADKCMRLAHYSKGACANVGANAAAAIFRDIELCAKGLEFASCSASLTALDHEMDRLRMEAATL